MGLSPVKKYFGSETTVTKQQPKALDATVLFAHVAVAFMKKTQMSQNIIQKHS